MLVSTTRAVFESPIVWSCCCQVDHVFLSCVAFGYLGRRLFGCVLTSAIPEFSNCYFCRWFNTEGLGVYRGACAEQTWRSGRISMAVRWR